jgi:cysteine-rich repeat protein
MGARSFAFVCLLGFAAQANGQAALLDGFGGPAGYGAELDVVNDGASGPLELGDLFPQGLDYFGTVYTDLYLNENGNLSFGRDYSAFVPLEFPLQGRPPMITPFWSDIDLCWDQFTWVCPLPPDIDNAVYLHLDTAGGRVIMTWHEVGYSPVGKDKANSFQLIITARPEVAATSFDIEFRYENIEWTAPCKRQVDGGLDCDQVDAQAGFDAGDGINFVKLPGSFTSDIANLVTTTNVGENGVWRYQVRDGVVSECGNGALEGSEECEEGDVTPNDGCSPDCRIEVNSDTDSWYDPYDNCDLVDNEQQEDLDNDGIGDACDDDIDGDGCLNGEDDNPLVVGPDQDGDGIHDSCDSDVDGDACPNETDPNPTVPEPDTLDSDGAADLCDNCNGVNNADQADADDDGVGDVCDNCPAVANAGQMNSDGDDVGDLCDNCRYMDNPDQADNDGDNIGDVCDVNPDAGDPIVDGDGGSVVPGDGGGITPADAGEADAGMTLDAGVRLDAGVTLDAGGSADSGSAPEEDAGGVTGVDGGGGGSPVDAGDAGDGDDVPPGCSCEASEPRGGAPVGGALAALLALAMWGRRATRRRGRRG